MNARLAIQRARKQENLEVLKWWTLKGHKESKDPQICRFAADTFSDLLHHGTSAAVVVLRQKESIKFAMRRWTPVKARREAKRRGPHAVAAKAARGGSVPGGTPGGSPGFAQDSQSL